MKLDDVCLANAASEMEVRRAVGTKSPSTGRVPASSGYDQKLPSGSDQDELSAGGWWVTAHRADSLQSTWGLWHPPWATGLPKTDRLREAGAWIDKQLLKFNIGRHTRRFHLTDH